MEFKDKQWGGKWDWLDIAATLIGGLIGQVIQILVLILII
nr:MAG TPA: putative periplasmic lipoprotein [Bacteriophage sp.]